MLALLDKLNAAGGIPPEVPAIGLLVILAVLAYFRSVVRQFAGMACLVLGGFAGWWVFRRIDSWDWINELNASWQVAISAIAGFFIYGIIRGIVRFFMDVGLLKLVGSLFGKKKGAGFLGSVLSIIPACFLVLVLGGILRFAGSVHDLERTQAALGQEPGTVAPPATPMAKIARGIDNSIIGRALDYGDPLRTKQVKSLTELLILSNDPTAWWALRNHPKIGPIVSNPVLATFRADPAIATALEKGDHAALLARDELWALAKDPEVAAALEEIDVDEVVTTALYKTDHATGERSRRQPRTSFPDLPPPKAIPLPE